MLSIDQTTSILLANGMQEADLADAIKMTAHFQAGVASLQIPMIDILTKSRGGDRLEEIDAKGLFERGNAVWISTHWVRRNFECRDPATNRKGEGFLHISPEFFARNIAPLYKLWDTAVDELAAKRNLKNHEMSKQDFVDMVILCASYNRIFAKQIRACCGIEEPEPKPAPAARTRMTR